MLRNDEEFINEWEKKKEWGMARYIFGYGSIFGLLLSLGILLFEYLNDSLNEVFLSDTYIKIIIMSLIFGYLLFGGAWWYQNRRYHRLKNME